MIVAEREIGDVQVTLRMPRRMVDQLKEMAAADQRSFSWIVRQLVDRELERMEREKKGGKR